MRLYAAISVAVVLIVVAIAMVGSVFPQMMRSSDTVRGQLLPATNAAIELRVIEGDLNRTMRTWALDGVPFTLEEHQRLRRDAEIQFVALRDYTGDDERLGILYAQVQQLHDAYLADVADEVIRLRTAGDVEAALDLAFSDEATRAYVQMTSASVLMRDALFEQRDEEVNDLHRRLVRLGGTLASIAGILLLMTIISYVTMTDWVLRPLERLRDQLRVSAGDDGHETPILPSGPPELANVGRDAEHLRRKLLGEIDEARAAREALGQDAPGVTAIRRELFPDLPDPDIDGLQVHGVQQPAHGVLAGDWWDCIRLGDNRIAVCVTDVAGHGPISGIAALRIKHIVNLVLTLGGTPAQAMRRIAETFEDEQSLFATAFLIVIDAETGEATWSNAGHVPPLLVRANGGSQVLEPTGPLLSTLGGEWTSMQGALAEGDTLLIPTDGIVESHSENGEILGEDGFADVERTTRGAAGDDLADHVSRIIAAIRDQATDWGRDDATLVAIRRTP
jgi:serine phosphatase RsbU (regulator of sigma subunit)/CHASE3 domain sensor protein